MKKENVDDWIKKKRARRGELDAEHLFTGIEQGDRAALSAGITLIESHRPEDREDANRLIQKCIPISGNSIRIGITGVPGVGKSTFIEAFGIELANKGKRVAVLAVDPTSSVCGGSILGDKTRMNDL